ncbi:hypothetical protein GCM10009550_04070 [Actinocorallia libanotica]|uniref:Uncharacterized protein n=2 Tax=Actinocorallia libanotica TaxID=46162 RepID=A0ABN1Q5H0_9ACTN
MAAAIAATTVAVPGGAAQGAEGDEWRVIRPVVTLPKRDLRDVEAVSAEEVWIAGYQYTSESAYFPILQRWNGENWRAYNPKGIGTEGQLFDLSAAGPNDVWVAGVREEDDETGLTDTYLGHWDGTAWTEVEAPPVNQGSQRLRHLAADGDGLWLAEANGRVFRREGATWTPHLDLGKRVITFDSLPSGEAWLRTQDSLHRWDGSAWSQVALPAGASLAYLQVNDTDGAWVTTGTGLAVWRDGAWQETPFPAEYQNARTVTASGGYWIYLRDDSKEGWVRWTGSDWEITSDLPQNTPGKQVMTDTAGRIWGIAYAYVPFLETSGKLVRYEGGKWETVPGLPRALYRMRAIPGTDKSIAVGVDAVTGDLKAITNG